MEQVVEWLSSLFAWFIGDLILQILIGGVFAMLFGACFGWLGIFSAHRTPIELSKSKENE
jgi:hypothetical protein